MEEPMPLDRSEVDRMRAANRVDEPAATATQEVTAGNPTSAVTEDPAPRGNDDLSIEEKIRRLEAESLDGYNVTKHQNSLTDLERFKGSSGRFTYYYKNISTYELSWTHKDVSIPALHPGNLIDFTKYFADEKQILEYKSIRRYEFPRNQEPFIKRLTQEEYLHELEIQNDLKRKKNLDLSSRQSGKVSSPTTDITSSVKYKVDEYTSWEKLPDEQKKSSKYSKYDFLSWINDYTFNVKEYEWMSYVVKDPEVLRAIMVRRNRG